MERIENTVRRSRRRFSTEQKQQILEEAGYESSLTAKQYVVVNVKT